MLVEQETRAKTKDIRNILSCNIAQLYAKAVGHQETLEGLSVVRTKLKSDKILFLKFCDLPHVEIGHAIDKVDMGICST